MKCQYCGQEHPDASRFCPVTGKTITIPEQRICVACGETIQEDLKFCPHCGAPPEPTTKKALPIIFPILIGVGLFVMIIGMFFTVRNLIPRIRTAISGTGSGGDEVVQELGRLADDDISSIAYSPNGRWLGTSSGDTVTIYDAENLAKIQTLKCDDTVTSLAFSPNEEELATGLMNGKVQVWIVPDGTLILTLDWQTDPVIQLTFSADGEILAFTTGKGFVYLCQAEDGSVIHRINAIVVQDQCLTFSPDANLLASCSSDSIQLWRVSDGSPAARFAPPAGEPSQLVFSPNGEFIAASSSSGIYLWGVEDGQLKIFGDSSGDGLAFTRDSWYIICGCDGKIEIWEVSNGQLKQVYEVGRYNLPGLVLSEADQILFSSLENGKVHSWTMRLEPSTPPAVADTGGQEPIQATTSLIPAAPTRTKSSSQPTETAVSIPLTETAVPSATNTPLPSATPLPTNTPTPAHKPIDLKVNPEDGAEIVLVPAGAFIMGSDDKIDPYFWGAEGPPHEVTLDEFWIYRHEVTNEMYQKCADAKACPRPDRNYSVIADEYYGNPQYADYPVIYVSHTHALSYCRWVGGSLPTEAQWEKAARGTDAYLFPWGNQNPSGSLVNLCDSRCSEGAEREPSIDDGYPGPAPIGSFPAGASPYGAYDMGGNVWEWTRDYFDPLYYNISPNENPLGPASGRTRVMRGGGWNNPNSGVRTVGRTSLTPNKSLDTLGFRCVLVEVP